MTEELEKREEKCYLCGKKATIHITIPVCGKCDDEYIKKLTEEAAKIHWNEDKREWEVKK